MLKSSDQWALPILFHHSEVMQRGDCGARKSRSDRQRVATTPTSEGIVGSLALKVRRVTYLLSGMGTMSVGLMENSLRRPPRHTATNDKPKITTIGRKGANAIPREIS